MTVVSTACGHAFASNRDHWQGHLAPANQIFVAGSAAVGKGPLVPLQLEGEWIWYIKPLPCRFQHRPWANLDLQQRKGPLVPKGRRRLGRRCDVDGGRAQRQPRLLGTACLSDNGHLPAGFADDLTSATEVDGDALLVGAAAFPTPPIQLKWLTTAHRIPPSPGARQTRVPSAYTSNPSRGCSSSPTANQACSTYAPPRNDLPLSAGAHPVTKPSAFQPLSSSGWKHRSSTRQAVVSSKRILTSSSASETKMPNAFRM